MSDEETPPEELEHHGVKGQKWGVRRDLSSAGQAIGREAAQMNDTTKKYLSIVAEGAGKTLSHKEAAANLAQNREKFAQKFGPSDGPIDKSGKGLSPKQKKILLGAAVGVGVLGGLYLAGKYGESKTGLSLLEDLSPTHHPGMPISVKDFTDASFKSQMKTWGFSKNGFITKESFARPAFELPTGHTFFRISTAAENEFRIPPGTYALSSVEDFHRYVINFAKEKGGVPLHQVKFQSTAPVKVPHLTDVLETVREVVSAEKGGKAVSEKEAIGIYKAMSGGSWSGAREQSLFTALTKKGFGALVDEMDAGVLGEKPLVIFGNQFSSKSSAPFTTGTLNAAAANLTEIGWRK